MRARAGLGICVAAALLAPRPGRAEGVPEAAAADEPEAPPPVQTLVEPGATGADLRVRQLPVRMRIRPGGPASPEVPDVRDVRDARDVRDVRGVRGVRDARVAPPRPPRRAGPRAAALPVATAAEAASAAAEPDASASRSATAATWSSIRERVTFQVRAGVDLSSAGDSGETLRGGARLPEDFAGSRPWILGDAIVGARNVLLPSLGAYFLSSFQLDASNSIAARSASVLPSDADELPIVVKAGYAEYGRDDVHRDKQLWLRGGRQFRLDGGSLFAYFDGLTIGYRARAWNASAFGGQRVSLYVDTDKGLTYGATAALDLGAINRVPLKVSANVMGLTLADATRMLGTLQATYELAKRATLHARARLVDSGSGLALGRAGGRLKLTGKRVVFVADLEQRQGGDLAYDLASPAAVDVVQVAQRLGVGLAAPIDALTLGARVDWRNRQNSVEVLAFGRAELPQETPRAVEHRGWYEGGLALAGAPLGARGKGVWTTAQYKLREYQPGEAADGMGSAFGDSSTSGLDRLHEASLDGSLSSGGGRRWRFNLGAFYRVYDFRSPYVEVANEGRGGGRVDLQIWITRDVRADLAAELAQPSPVLARELGTMSSLRGAVEAKW